MKAEKNPGAAYTRCSFAGVASDAWTTNLLRCATRYKTELGDEKVAHTESSMDGFETLWSIDPRGLIECLIRHGILMIGNVRLRIKGMGEKRGVSNAKVYEISRKF